MGEGFHKLLKFNLKGENVVGKRVFRGWSMDFGHTISRIK